MAEILVSQKAIAEYLGISLSKFKGLLPELRSAGVVFTRINGRPPQRRTCAVKSVLINWITLKAEKGETI